MQSDNITQFSLNNKAPCCLSYFSFVWRVQSSYAVHARHPRVVFDMLANSLDMSLNRRYCLIVHVVLLCFLQSITDYSERSPPFVYAQVYFILNMILQLIYNKYISIFIPVAMKSYIICKLIYYVIYFYILRVGNSYRRRII